MWKVKMMKLRVAQEAQGIVGKPLQPRHGRMTNTTNRGSNAIKPHAMLVGAESLRTARRFTYNFRYAGDCDYDDRRADAGDTMTACTAIMSGAHATMITAMTLS
jgi:hypothetical protein